MIQHDTLTIDYRDYKKPDSLPTGRLVEANDVQMHIVEGGSAGTVIVPRAFDAFSGSGFEQQRDRVLAHELGARVVGIDIPGIGLNHTAKMTERQLNEAKKGSLASGGETTIDALVQALDLTSDQELRFIGYSMGGWMLATILASPAFRKYKLRVGDIHLVEPVNDQDWQLPAIGKALFTLEFKHAKRYYRETEEKGFSVQPPSIAPENPLTVMKDCPAMSQRDRLTLAKGMRVGFAPMLTRAVLADKHDDATGLSEAPLTIYRANGSTATRPDALHATVEMMRNSGQRETRVVELVSSPDAEPHRHLLWHSMGAVGMLAAQINS